VNRSLPHYDAMRAFEVAATLPISVSCRDPGLQCLHVSHSKKIAWDGEVIFGLVDPTCIDEKFSSNLKFRQKADAATIFLHCGHFERRTNLAFPDSVYVENDHHRKGCTMLKSAGRAAKDDLGSTFCILRVYCLAVTSKD
jgi:hypothetical protein